MILNASKYLTSTQTPRFMESSEFVYRPVSNLDSVEFDSSFDASLTALRTSRIYPVVMIFSGFRNIVGTSPLDVNSYRLRFQGLIIPEERKEDVIDHWELAESVGRKRFTPHSIPLDGVCVTTSARGNDPKHTSFVVPEYHANLELVMADLDLPHDVLLDH